MAITQVQKTTAGTNGGSASVTGTLAAPATAGNLLVAVLAHQGAPTITTTPPENFVEATSVDSPRIRLYYKIAVGGENNLTFTLTSNQNKTLTLFEYSGVHSTPLDVVANTNSSSNPVSQLLIGPTTHTAQNDELVIVGFATTPPNTFTLDNNFVKQSEHTVSTHMQCTAHRITTIYGSFSTLAQITTAAITSGVLATIKATTTSEKTAAPAHIASGTRWLGPYRTKVWNGTDWE